MIWGMLLMKKYGFISSEPISSGSISIIPIIIFTFMMLAVIPCIIFSLIHTVKALKYSKIYNKEKHYGEWHYSGKVWTRLIMNNFRTNNAVELKSFSKAAIYFFVVIFLAFLLDFLINAKDRKHIFAYILIALITFFVFFARVMVRSFISMLDHILFTNRSIILMESTIIVNEEVINLNVPLKKEIRKKQIRSGNLEIEYAVPARYSDKYSNKRCLDVKDIKKLVIPIPSGKHEEAEKYVKAPLPIK